MKGEALNPILLGAISMASLLVGVGFLRFWRDTKDRLFLFFAASFIVDAINRVASGMNDDPSEGRPLFYFIRFLSFVLIVVGIVLKNLERGSGARSEPTAADARRGVSSPR